MMKIYFCAVTLFLMIVSSSDTVAQNVWASHILAHQFGGGQTVGQSSDYFPKNVLDKVSTNATPTSPANTPDEIVSLGRNGWVAVGFERPIINGEGADFVVFENAFNYPPNNVFDEWMRVSVSEDGINWIDFPVDTLTGSGMAGRTPTNGANATQSNAANCGGDAFDLSVVGLSQILYVKVTDATKYQTPDKLSAELDAIGAIHLANENGILATIPTHLLDFQQDDFYLYFQTYSLPISLKIYNLQGQTLQSFSLSPQNSFSIAKSLFPKNLYLMEVETSNAKYFQKILL